jgi:hypothetical protein
VCVRVLCFFLYINTFKHTWINLRNVYYTRSQLEKYTHCLGSAYVCMLVHAWICVWQCLHASIYVRMHAIMCVCVCVFILIYVHVSICQRMCSCILYLSLYVFICWAKLFVYLCTSATGCVCCFSTNVRLYLSLHFTLAHIMLAVHLLGVCAVNTRI